MIKFYCEQCSKKIGVPEEYAGKRVKCPQCRTIAVVPEPETVPAPEVHEDPYAVDNNIWSDDMFEAQQRDEPQGEVEIEYGKNCPSCQNTCELHALVCVHCGYDFQTGSSLEVKVEREKEVERRRKPGKSMNWMGVGVTGAAVLVLGFIFIWSFASSDKEMVGAVTFWGGLITLIVARIWFLIVAYQESTMWGMLCWWVPFAEVAFFFTHIEESWKPTVLYFMGCCVFIVAIFGMVAGGIDDFLDFELTEEDLVEYINDPDYMFQVGCWYVDQFGDWDDYDVQYDGEFADLLPSYRGGWFEPPANRKALIEQEIAYVEEIVAEWTEQEKRDHVTAYYEEEYGEFLDDGEETEPTGSE